MEDARGVKRKLDVDLLPRPPRRIQALDQDVVNKIAAGEIIVAPVHALKELIENAVDAGSTSLEILVKDGGLKLLQITDNGHGIDRDDLPILCERFTTSKLQSFEDLSNIGTYGFRGEALASISHIAHLTVTTKTKATSCAFKAKYSGGKLTPGARNPEPCAGRQGTQITVEDLFYNVPTRRRAFRSASEEYSKILDMVGKYAVHCAGVALSCRKQGDSSNSIMIQGAAHTLDRIRQVHSSAVANELLAFNASNEAWGFEATGYASNANYHVKRTQLLLFINNRAVESSVVKKAVEHTYSLFLPKGGHPFVYIDLQIDPKRVDVNVHPTKREVNFLNEDEIIDQICTEIRVRLGSVDTSRTFMTQSVLPGIKVPTISSESSGGTAKRNNGSDSLPDDERPPEKSQRTPASRPYENNLVRTDSRAQKITNFMTTSTDMSSSPPKHDSAPAQTHTDDDENDERHKLRQTTYTVTDREPTVLRLASVKALRADVRESMHGELTEVFSTHTFVGIVDHQRRLAAIQSGVKLFLVDYGMVTAEFFYQLGLTDFANFGMIQLDPALPLREVIGIAADKKQRTSSAQDIDWSLAADMVTNQLVERREMLAEYFSFEVSEDGQLCGLPLLMKEYMPSMGKLPEFLLRLGPMVDWNEEKTCFLSFLRLLASWYVPEAISNEASTTNHSREHVDEMDVDDVGPNTDPTSADRRLEISRLVETVLFPAFKARLIGTKPLLKGVTELANLKGLYRVFERC
ncbi:MAG: hypothetical protein Q9159_001576 [Coniocarpon cinnabarinum]